MTDGRGMLRIVPPSPLPVSTNINHVAPPRPPQRETISYLLAPRSHSAPPLPAQGCCSQDGLRGRATKDRVNRSWFEHGPNNAEVSLTIHSSVYPFIHPSSQHPNIPHPGSQAPSPTRAYPTSPPLFELEQIYTSITTVMTSFHASASRSVYGPLTLEVHSITEGNRGGGHAQERRNTRDGDQKSRASVSTKTAFQLSRTSM